MEPEETSIPTQALKRVFSLGILLVTLELESTRV